MVEPFSTPTPERTTAGATTRAEGTRRPGVLVVDDAAPLRDLLRAVLQLGGFTVWVAADGQEAVELYRLQGRAIDLVLLDVQMPGLDGVQTLAALQALDPGVRCCFMSGHLGPYSPEDLRAWGSLSLFLKPFSAADLVQTIAALTREAEALARP
jgi:CheY-like chemotaxis protein